MEKIAIDFAVTVTDHDRITGNSSWETTINGLIDGHWDLTPEDIDLLECGETVKCISPNGRRIIWVKAK